jgi:hypothetical protein
MTTSFPVPRGPSSEKSRGVAERLDFAERLLAQPRPADGDPISTLKA